MAANLTPICTSSSITAPRYPIIPHRVAQYHSELGREFFRIREGRKLSIQRVSREAEVREELIALLEDGRPTGKYGAIEVVERLANFYGRTLAFYDSRTEYECPDELIRMDDIATAGVRVFMRMQ